MGIFESNEVVMLQVGEPKRLKFSGYREATKTINDTQTGEEKEIPALMLDVVEEGGVPVKKVLSVIQKKLAGQLKPYIDNGDILKRTFIINRQGVGFKAGNYSVVVE